MDVADNDAREAVPPGLGDTLARARDEQGLSRNDVAQRLHMSPSQVEALESGDYTRLPRGMFLRGFVRNYAKLVGLDPEAVLPLLAGDAPRDAAPRIVVPTQNIRFDPLGQRFSSPWIRSGITAGVLLALAFAAMYWWVFVRPEMTAQREARILPADAVTEPSPGPATAPPVEAPPAASPAGSAAPAANVPANIPAMQRSVASSAPAPNASNAPSIASVAPPAASAPAPAANAPALAPAANAPAPTAKAPPAAARAGERLLHFRFKGESWVEVRDAGDRIVFQQLNSAGSEASVHARPPLQVVVGNAPEVEMDKDGQPFDLDPVTHVAVARFKVE
ncbi:MAG TPA: RodZ domain-containing protein [Usitatibacter sp.]|jgi:cytoskeleton protein RodZ|nr:RodZ domain-containing protein [Usitatibacter sp.]